MRSSGSSNSINQLLSGLYTNEVTSLLERDPRLLDDAYRMFAMKFVL